MTTENRQWLIAERPTGRPLQESDFKLTSLPLRQPAKGEVLLRSLYLSFDPAQKGWMENIGGYVAPTEIGDVMRGYGLAQVIASQSPRLAAGDLVAGFIGWQEYPTLQASELEKLEKDGMLTANASVLGLTGLTAYFGLFDIGQPRAGDVLVVSGAAGATGSVVGQLGKIAGCRVVGIAGGAEKCAWLVKDCGFDAAIDYKGEDVQSRLKQLCPDGIDVFYDNVGGKILNVALGRLALGARVVICGGISRYELGKMPAGPENYFNLIFKRASMRGFIVLDYAAQYAAARKRLRAWIASGQLTYKEDIQEGFEKAPQSLMRLFTGRNFGKQMLKLADPD